MKRSAKSLRVIGEHIISVCDELEHTKKVLDELEKSNNRLRSELGVLKKFLSFFPDLKVTEEAWDEAGASKGTVVWDEKTGNMVWR